MRKFFAAVLVVLTLLFSVNYSNAATVNDKVTFDTTQLNKGIIMVASNTGTGKKIKLMVTKGDNKVTYNLKDDGKFEGFSLQYGNGDYKVSVLKNKEGTKYEYIATTNVTLNLDNKNSIFLGSVQNVNWNKDMAAAAKAAELTKNAKTDREKITTVYNYIVKNFSYDYNKLNNLNYDYLPNIDKTLAEKSGICYDFASLFAAMLRSQGIPTKLVKGYADKVNGYHAWNEVYDSATGKWITIDTTYDSQMNAAKAKYKMEKNKAEYQTVYEY
jgi:transglutaminase-like putative cysteine protease